MSEVAIRVEGLSKQYRIGGKRSGYRTLRDVLASAAANPFRRIREAFGKASERATGDSTVWALEDVSFEVKRGKVVGIIGRNGAGKTTLLKILSRITEPTRGFAEIHGRVGSLLEVGTGFHPELTGRENIYLNGAILGMKRVDIIKRFDAIVAFAEVERFIDTPVKHFSTGMYLRLAFAVAAHLEPEILLVDEVLAVGDAAFQKRCLGKMDEVAAAGRTVLFVSHNMGAVRSLCSEGIVLDGGRVIESGSITKSIETYHRILTPREGAGASGSETGVGVPGGSRLGAVSVHGDNGGVRQSEGFKVRTTLSIGEPVAGFSVICVLEDVEGKVVFHVREESSALGLRNVDPGAYEVDVRVPALWMVPGLYAVMFKVLFWGNLRSGRIVSDKYPVDVDGVVNQGQAMLQPVVKWSVQAIKRQEPPAQGFTPSARSGSDTPRLP